MLPRVSVLVNNYNYGRYLAQALDSVLAQDFPADELEIIAVDDGSRDESRAVLERYAERVRIILHPENRGQAVAFNSGFAEARGEYLCLLDSDDWWEKDKLSRVVATFEREPDAGIVQHPCRAVTVKGIPVGEPPGTLPARFVAADYLRGTAFCAGTTGLCFRAAALRKILPVPEELRICADAYLFYLLLHAPVANLSELLGSRRFHDRNGYVTRWRDPRKLAMNLAAAEVLERELDRMLEAAGLELSAEMLRLRRIEGRLSRLFLARYAKNWREAVRQLGLSLEEYRGPRRAAKAAALLLLLASPTVYLDVQAEYARLFSIRT
jgi:glycosyltransferase involved in cell wall biosynthesis